MSNCDHGDHGGPMVTTEELAAELGEPVSAIWRAQLEGAIPVTPCAGDALTLNELARLAEVDFGTAARLLADSVRLVPEGRDADERLAMLAAHEQAGPAIAAAALIGYRDREDREVCQYMVLRSGEVAAALAGELAGCEAMPWEALPVEAGDVAVIAAGLLDAPPGEGLYLGGTVDGRWYCRDRMQGRECDCRQDAPA